MCQDAATEAVSQAFRLHPPGELPIGSTLPPSLWGTCRSLAQDQRMEDGKNSIQNLFCNKGGMTWVKFHPPSSHKKTSSIWGSHRQSNHLIFFWCPTVKPQETLRGLTWVRPLHGTFRRGPSLNLLDSPGTGAKSCWQGNYCCNMRVFSFFILQE